MSELPAKIFFWNEKTGKLLDTYSLSRCLFQFSPVYFHVFDFLFYDLKRKFPKKWELKVASLSSTCLDTDNIEQRACKMFKVKLELWCRPTQRYRYEVRSGKQSLQIKLAHVQVTQACNQFKPKLKCPPPWPLKLILESKSKMF